MQIQIISQTFLEDKTQFKIPELTTRWDQIVLVVTGAYSFTVAGEEKPRVIREKEIVFVPAGTTLSRTIIEPLTYGHIAFMAPADHPFRMALRMGKLTLPTAQLDAIFQSMQRAVLMPNNQELIEHIVQHVLVEHYMFGKADRVHLRPLSEEVLSTVRYMNRNLGTKIDMDELAARVYLSHTGLIWKFRQELNTTPSQYLILLRLRYAKQLLLNHDYTVTEVAEMCGYSNPYYFTNAFRQYSGMSPTEFRKHYLERTK